MRFALIAALAISMLGCAGTPPEPPTEIYPGYTWRDLGNGIYVHGQTHPLAGPVDGNSTVIVGDDGVFVIDTHINPAVARAVIDKIREITDRPVTHVVNTHWHDDHVNGNHAYRNAFPNATFIAHSATLAALEDKWADFEDQRRATYERVAAVDLAAIADSIAETDPDRSMGITMFASYRDALAPELPSMELVYPEVTFDEQLVFEQGGRTIVVQWLGPANTEGDAIVWLPGEKLLITGDVLVAPVPYAFDSPMADWVETLGKLAALEPETIIPGHGAVQHDQGYLTQVTGLLQATLLAVENAKAAGADDADLTEAVDLTEQEALFTGGDAERAFAWRSYFLEPGVKSAWVSLGYAVPEAK